MEECNKVLLRVEIVVEIVDLGIWSWCGNVPHAICCVVSSAFCDDVLVLMDSHFIGCEGRFVGWIVIEELA